MRHWDPDTNIRDQLIRVANAISRDCGTVRRTVYSMRKRAHLLGVAAKGPSPFREFKAVQIAPEPEGIFFEDHPDTILGRNGGRYVRGES